MSEDISLEEFREYIRQVALKEVQPHADRADKEEIFPEASFRALAANDLLGVNASPEFGGMGLSNQHYAVMIEELTRVCSATAVTVAVHTGLVV